MRWLPFLFRRSMAVGLLTVSAAPLVGVLQMHVPDHDGVAHHIEAAHGHHAPALADGDDRRTAAGLQLLAPAAPAPGAHTPALGSVRGGEAFAEAGIHAARGPPGVQRARAPPHLT